MPTSRIAERIFVKMSVQKDVSCDKSYADDLVSFRYCKLRSSLELRLAEVHPRSPGLSFLNASRSIVAWTVRGRDRGGILRLGVFFIRASFQEFQKVLGPNGLEIGTNGPETSPIRKVQAFSVQPTDRQLCRSPGLRAQALNVCRAQLVSCRPNLHAQRV